MKRVLELSHVDIDQWHNLDLCFNDNELYSIIGCNKCGKTSIFRLLTSLKVTNNCLIFDGKLINQHNRYQYLQKIGIVKSIPEQRFFFDTVLKEMEYPLINLGFNKQDCMKKINAILSLFNETNLINRKINSLSKVEKQKILIMISLLHEPRILFLDNALNIFNDNELKRIIGILKSQNICIINFTSQLRFNYLQNNLMFINDNKIIEIDPLSIYNDDTQVLNMNLNLPFLVDLNLKLKLYNLINKNYYNLEDMVNDIWP